MGVTELTLRGIAFAGRRLCYRYNASSLSLQVTRDVGDAGTELRVTDAAGKAHALDVGAALELPLQRVLLHPSAHAGHKSDDDEIVAERALLRAVLELIVV